MIKRIGRGVNSGYWKSSSNLAGAARRISQKYAKPFGRSSLNVFGAAAGVTAAYTVGRIAGVKAVSSFRKGLIKGLFPGSAMPMESGRFGVRTTSTPAGISGIRFNFRRK